MIALGVPVRPFERSVYSSTRTEAEWRRQASEPREAFDAASARWVDGGGRGHGDGGGPGAERRPSGIAARAAPAKSGVMLGDLSWLEAEKALTDSTVVVIPLGAAAVQHGPHLKLNNDERLARYLASRVQAAASVVIAPALTYHFHPAFLEYPGSTSLSRTTARDMTVDIVEEPGEARAAPVLRAEHRLVDHVRAGRRREGARGRWDPARLHRHGLPPAECVGPPRSDPGARCRARRRSPNVDDALRRSVRRRHGQSRARVRTGVRHR